MDRENRVYRGPIQHDFLGDSYLIDGKWVRQGGLTREDLAFIGAMGKSERWSKAIASITESWDEIPQINKVSRGSLILYRHNGQIPNIHHKYYPNIPLVNVTAFPDKIDSVNKIDGQIVSITVTETRFTSFRDPVETLQAFKNEAKTSEKAIDQMRKISYLRDEQMIIPAADFRLFDDINQFLTEKFNLNLPKMSQEFEPIFGNC